MVANGEPLKVPQTLATAQDPQQHHKEQVPGRDTSPSPNPGIGDRLQKADQVEISWRRNDFRYREVAVLQTSPHVGSQGQGANDTRCISHGQMPDQMWLHNLGNSVSVLYLASNHRR